MSNQYTNGRSKPYIESFNRIDLKITDNETLKKHYEKRGYIKVKVSHPDNADKKFTVKILLDRIQATYGYRYYIECEGCSKRVNFLLYTFITKNDKKALACGCRHCFGTNYMGQQVGKNDTDYNLYMIRKLGRKLDPEFVLEDGLSYPMCPPKPKHMWYKTYDKINTEFNKHVNEVRDKHNRLLGAIRKEMM